MMNLNFRPCPGCLKEEPGNDCSPSCPEAAQSLSSEPEQYPLEPFVVAIVFELNSLYQFQACWSCEGHRDHNNKLWKLPQVSFYATSPLYPQLLSNYLNRLLFQKRLLYPWAVNFTTYGQTMANTYCLEPKMAPDAEMDLDLLQKDLVAIGTGLSDNIRNDAFAMLKGLK